MLAFLKEKLSAASSSISGFLSLLGSYNVCHNACLSMIAFLALVGISLEGMPLAFLQPLSVPLWLLAFFLFVFSGYLYFSKKCIPKTHLAFNTGVLIAAIPFAELSAFQPYFWIIGFSVAGIATFFWIKKKIFLKEEKTCHKK